MAPLVQSISLWSHQGPSQPQQQQQQPAQASGPQPAQPPSARAGVAAPAVCCTAAARRKRLSETGDLDNWMEPYTGSFYGFFADGARGGRKPGAWAHAPLPQGRVSWRQGGAQ